MLGVIKTTSADPSYNLAMEQYLVEQKTERYFYFWRNDRSVIVGKNQNTLSEIDLDFVEQNGIRVVRRNSGGGAVFHDLGNVNFSFVTNCRPGDFIDFAKYTQPIVAALAELGVSAELSGRNDLIVDGAKVSGNAQYIRGERLLHHGTLLFGADLSNMAGALRAKPEKFSGKAAQSVRERVGNLKDYIAADITVEQFIERLEHSILKTQPGAAYASLAHSELAEIERIAEEKYRSWVWNFGRSPKYNFQKQTRLGGSLVAAALLVEKGVMTSVDISGDFFGKADIAGIEQRLTGRRHDPADIAAALDGVDIADYISGAALSEFIELLK